MLLPPLGIGEFDVFANTFALVASTRQRVVNQSPMRIALIFGQGTGQYTVSIRNNVGVNQGIIIQTSVPPFTVLWSDYGALVNSDWYAIAGAAVTIEITEVLYVPTANSQIRNEVPNANRVTADDIRRTNEYAARISQP